MVKDEIWCAEIERSARRYGSGGMLTLHIWPEHRDCKVPVTAQAIARREVMGAEETRCSDIRRSKICNGAALRFLLLCCGIVNVFYLLQILVRN